MDIIRQKRDHYRIEIRKQQTEQVFREKRQQLLNCCFSQFLAPTRLNRLSKNNPGELNNFYVDLMRTQVDHPIQFELLDNLFQLEEGLIDSVFTIILSYLYEQGQEDHNIFLECLASEKFYNQLLYLWNQPKNFNSSSQSALLLTQCVKSLNSKQLQISKLPKSIMTNLKRLVNVFLAWLTGKRSELVIVSIQALECLSNYEQFHEKLSKEQNIVRLCSSNIFIVQDKALDIIGNIAVKSDNTCIQNLMKENLFATLSNLVTSQNHSVKFKVLWIIGNIALYEQFAKNLLMLDRLVTVMINYTQTENLKIREESCFALGNLIDYVDLVEFEHKFKYSVGLIEILKCPNLSRSCIECNLRQIYLYCNQPSLLKKIVSLPFARELIQNTNTIWTEDILNLLP